MVTASPILQVTKKKKKNFLLLEAGKAKMWAGKSFIIYTEIQGFGSGSAWIRINLSCWIRIRIQIADPDPGGQKWPQK